ncbi:subtilisin-like protein [Mycena alexandri]|uniref:tripeptidyl-peptidase II n=1 Tax=Mycena alexandri TaxID=1745969 RepID=A0AAD6XIB3_9AGAR|nr:subtilisin-like protein [Mycena alexandri]
MALKLLTVLSISVLVSAGGMVVHESRRAAPAGFVKQGAAPANATITLRVGLASNNVGGLEERLMSIATPGSSEFRQWLSMDEVKAFVQPSPETRSAFDSFASGNGLRPTVISPSGDWVSITLPISQANDLFAAQFEVFTSPSLVHPITRTLSVSLPSELVGHVDVLHPTTAFPDPNPRLGAAVSVDTRLPAKSCNSNTDDGVITPACLQALYGIPATAATQSDNALLVTGYANEFAQDADLAEFLKLLRPDIPANQTFAVLTIDNGTNTQDSNLTSSEANLDIQYAAGIATGVPLQFLSVGNSFSNADFMTALMDTTTFLQGVANPPTVMTTSYGLNEALFGSSLATKICNGYMALGARGISALFSSGDGGVRGLHDNPNLCQNNTFIPTFPASCGFVTSVGATQGFAPEKAVNFSSGGFSNIFPAPSYQTAAIAKFMETLPSDFSGDFNRTGRGYPDVSLQGLNFEIVFGGATALDSGTSASAPAMAAIIALINDRLLAAGRPVLGFLNPFIYSTASNTFTDITTGRNPGYHCNDSAVAFDAVAGWDPLTGFGTPNFEELLAAAME